jgi:hypothetical protein
MRPATMAATHLDAELQHNERRLLLSNRADGNNNMSPMQKAIGQTYQSTAHLAKLLPSGTVLSFQILAPTLAKQGHCSDMNRMMTGGLVVLCDCPALFSASQIPSGVRKGRYDTGLPHSGDCGSLMVGLHLNHFQQQDSGCGF